MAAADWRSELAERFPDAKSEEPMSQHTTFGIGGPAERFVRVRSRADARDLFALLRRRGVPYFVLGWGSNLLVRDGGLRGVVAMPDGGEFAELRRLSGTRLWAGAAVRLPRLVTWCAEHDLAGAEPLVGVPGMVGGALVMNAGTRDGEIGDLVRKVDLLDPATGAEEERPRERIAFAYRSSGLEGLFLVGAELELRVGDKGVIMRRVQELQLRRSRTQPIHTRNVGSVFKNPPGRFVASLIEGAGLKGFTVGGARVSPLHANFIENRGGASAEDVLAIVGVIRRKVRLRHGLKLELEMQVVGDEARGRSG